MSAVGPAGVDIGLSIGSTLAGVFGSLVLYGISVLQTFIYYVSYPDDSASKKLLVIIVFLLDTVHSVLACAGMWNYLVQHFGDLANIMVLHATVIIPVLITTKAIVTPTIAESGRFHCPIFLHVADMVFQYSAVMTPTVTVVDGPLLTKVANVHLGLTAAVDVIIATVMCTLLAKGRTGFNKRTDRVLFRWIIISINTGVWTAFFAVFTLVLHALHPSDLLLSATYYPICTVYGNTLLANFNARLYVASIHAPSLSSSNRPRHLEWNFEAYGFRKLWSEFTVAIPLRPLLTSEW
ncbi:hypothetical protein BS17DRAFT_766243 [Gyrodon lividus]|nr:hypothetical protein BS17DRAFT_766243 [Gyrodon lividus]